MKLLERCIDNIDCFEKKFVYLVSDEHICIHHKSHVYSFSSTYMCIVL